MKKLRRRIFAAVLAALMMVTAMPTTALYASAETETVSDNAIGQAGTEDTEETVDGDTEETEIDGAGETVDGGTEEPAQEPSAGPLEEDTARCICETLCTEDSINGDCPVCGAEGADLSACKGKEQGSAPETDTEDDNAGADTAACICEILCTQDSINGDCPVCGADDADLSACKGKEQGSAPEKDTEDDNAGTDTAECICKALCTEDSINGDCPVCGTEDADLSRCKGEKTKEQEKTGEKVITAWEWIDPEEYLTDGILALPGAGRENPAFVEDVTALLPEKIQAKVAAVNAAEDGEETEEDAEAAPETEDAEITLTGWKCASYPEDGAYEGTYTFTAFLPEGFVLAEDAAALEVEVELGGGEMLEGEVSVTYQEASWNGGVTYTTKTADSCTPVADSTTAVTWNAGWYVVNSTVTISEPITVTGAVNLILGDGCTLNAEKGIVVTTGNSLTIYAQSGGTGTLTATGTADSNNASAGIGGSGTASNSGTTTIHGGVINAIGGVSSLGDGAAGIGGGTVWNGNGGSSGTVTIYGGTVTANSGAGNITGAGIGGGGGDAGGAGSNITIYGGSVTAASTGTQSGGAGIGGGGGGNNGGTGSNIQIYGGTINATGSSFGAGVGGGGAGIGGTSGAGTNITVSGGTVTAIGGNYAAGIGGGGGYSAQYSGCTGGTGSVTISGGIVDASSPTDVYWTGYEGAPIGNGGNTTATATVNKTTAIVFENGAGTVCGAVTLDRSYTVPAGYTLNIPAGASLSGSGILSGGSAFTTENLTEDMISVPEDLSYTGEDLTETIENAVTLNGEVTICGQTFTASTDGWELSVEKVSDLKYTVKYTHVDKEPLTKDVIIAQKSIGEAAVSITGPFTYNTEAHTPDPAVTLDGKTLVKDTDYTVAYANNTNAGSATITVTGKGNYAGTVEKTFTIEKATPTLAWENTTQELIYTGNEARITAPKATAPDGTQLNITHDTGSCQFSYKAQGDSGFTDGLPINAGTYTIRARVEEKGNGNYTAADSTNTLTLTIKPADQDAPDAPAATEDNIKDTSITLTAVENAQYSMDGTNWQDSPVFAGLEANKTYTFYVRLKADKNHNASPGSTGKSITTRKTSLGGAAVTVSGSYAYTGAAVVPAAGEVTVELDGKKIDSGQYTITASNNIHAGTAAVTVTATGAGDYSGSASTTFLIEKATLTIKANSQTITYGGSIATGIGQVTVTGLCGDTLNSITLTASTTDVPGGTIMPSAAQIKNGSNEDVAANYNITYQPGKLTVSYMDFPDAILYNGEAEKGWYNGDVVITADDYTVSDTLGGDYEASYTISAQEGTVTKTLYFKDGAGHMSDGVEVTVKFDLTPPTGEIAVGAKWWQNVLHFISFGNYAAKEYTVTIKAEDKNGSGISKIEYVIVAGTDQYTDAGKLEEAGLSWTEYDSSSRPTVDADTSQYVVYARLTDNVGNVTYISTDGILLDRTAPTVDGLAVPEETKKDVTAGFTFTVNEAADYYYVVLPKDSNAPSAEDIIVTCGGTLPEGKTGNAIAGTVSKGSGAVSADTPGVSVDIKNLSPNTAYTVYVTAVDRAVDITDSAQGKPAGNIAVVQKADFTTKKTLPVITKAPAVAGTYGQSVGEMTITGGTAQAGSTVLVGTWAVGDADKDKKPSAGTAEVTVIFTPGNADYDSVSVQASLTVSQRNLNAEGVTVSEVAGTYTYIGSEIRPPVAVGTGTPAAGIYISDSGAALTASDFTVSYSNHKDAGTASVTITGKGNYTGSVTRTFTIGKAPGREVPDVSGSYTDNGQTYTYTVTPTEGAVYRMGNDGKWQEENVFEGITPGTSVTFYAKMPETGNYEDGTPKSITVDFPKLTPAAPALSYKADRTNPADVKVTITPVSGAEYSFDGGKTWTESNEQGGFTTSQTVVLAIRLKETDTHNQSPVQTVTVNLAKKDREAPPAFSLKVEANGETDYTVTIPATEGCEYSFDGEHWSDVNVKTGVSVGETVTGYKRYKETNDYNASSAVSAKETMPKFTVKTPVISPAGGSYTGNVSVTITCASPDAEIYYTTDGSAPGRGSTRYTGAFTVTAPATVKAIAVKEGLTDSAEASVTYTKKSDSGSGSGGNGGGNSGGNEDNGGQGSGGGGSTNPGNGSTTPPIPVIPPAENINPGNGATPGTGTTPVNPGTENTVRPGSGAGTPVQGAKQPFIKGEDGKIGWGVIRAEEEKAQEGSTINVDMNGSTVVPGDIFDSIKGKDIIITFDMGNGILWSVDGKSITTDKAGDIDFSVKTGVNTVPVDIINNVTGESYSIQISLAYEGEFGFTAVLSIGLGKENAGYTASLYYYNESTGELEFICKDQIAEDGTVSLAFTHASDYVISVDIEAMDGKEGVDNTPETPRTGDYSIIADVKENDEATWIYKLVIAVGTIVVVAGFGIIFIWKKKKEEQ